MLINGSFVMWSRWGVDSIYRPKIMWHPLQKYLNSAAHILDEVSIACSQRITTLKMINISRLPFEMLAVPTFVNLVDLYISPHNIGPDLVEAFGMSNQINLYLYLPFLDENIFLYLVCRWHLPSIMMIPLLNIACCGTFYWLTLITYPLSM